MRLDTQVHLLDPSAHPYPPDTTGYRPGADETGTLADFAAVMDAHGVERAVLVQASTYALDNAAILAAARRHPDRFRCVVAAADPDAVTGLAAHAAVRGVRLNLTDDRGLIGRGVEHARAIASAAFAAGLLVQVQAVPPTLTALLEALPQGPVVIDHMGRPDLSPGSSEPDAVAALAARPQTWLKVSGLFRLRAGDRPAQHPEGDERLRRLVNAFRPHRLLWGSDWPFINLGGPRPSYADTLRDGHALLGPKTDPNAAAARLFGWTCGDG